MRRTTAAEAEIRRRMGAIIEARRAVRSIAPAVLAAAAEVDDRQMARVLAGKAGLSFHSLGRVATALGCTAEEIVAEARVQELPVKRRVSSRPAA